MNYNNDRSRWFCQFLCFFFCLLVDLFLTSCLSHCCWLYFIFHRDFTNPNLPTEQKGRPSQVCSVGSLFIYLRIKSVDLCEVHSNICIFPFINSLDMVMQEICMLLKVLEPGQVLNIFNCFGRFGLVVTLCYFLMYWRLSFFLFTVGFPQVGIFHVQLKWYYWTVDIWSYHDSFCILWK